MTVALLAGIGGVLGLFVAIVWSASGPSDSDWNPVQIVVTYTDPPVPGVDAVAKVELFSKWRFTLSAPRKDTLLFWTDVLSMLPQIAVIAFGAFLGWWCGKLLTRRRNRKAQ